MRPIVVTKNIFPHAAGSVLLEFGTTKVLCAVTIEEGVPRFLKGKGIGWLTAEYAMLPASTFPRTIRESVCGKPQGRSMEISRMIGRSLRTVVDLSGFGEKTIHVDCDVLTADGGTRTVAITGACYALKLAQEKWLIQQIIATTIVRQDIAAVSVALCGSSVVLDPDYQEDSSCDADFNFVIARDGNILEVQGSAEKTPISWDRLCMMKDIALGGVEQIFRVLDN
jgi:ribonuclease PH